MRSSDPGILRRFGAPGPSRGLALAVALGIAAPFPPAVAHAGPSMTEIAEPSQDEVLPETEPEEPPVPEAEVPDEGFPQADEQPDEPQRADASTAPGHGSPSTSEPASTSAGSRPGGAERETADTDLTTPRTAPSALADGSEQAKRLPALERAAWWTLFGAFVMGTTAGVLGGLAEREENKALRLAVRIDPDRGTQPLYEARQEDYERALDRGRTFDRAAIGLAISTGVAAAIGIGLFIASRRRPDRGPRRARSSGAGVEVRF